MEEKVHQLNAELKARLKDVIALDKELDAFSYSVSHALRAPVRDMEGFADLLNKHCSAVLDAEGRRYINAISGSAKKMGRLMDDLLGFSRMGKAELKKTRIHLNSLISEVLGEIAPIHEGRRIDWKIGKLPEVYADREMLRLVFVNLLSNAVKYTGQRETAIVEINGYANGSNELIFYVRDNGVGFDMNYVDKLFQVFHRLHGNVEFEGTGIGLANVRRIIHRHRGRTWAEGTVNKGATFYFSLPGEIQD